MDIKVERSLNAALDTFATVSGNDASGIKKQLAVVFDAEKNFMDKTDDMDTVFDDFPKFDELREVCFDLLMINFFSSDVKKLEEDYLETKEWEEIEEATIDRGTELLNLLLYINECKDEDIDPTINDFLTEFLLVEDDEFQDEYRIYEDLIANQLLADSSIEEIAKVAEKLDAESEIRDLFNPIMGFFYEQNPSTAVLATFTKNSSNPAFETSVYSLITNFNQI